jgi:hypothetical protein
MRCPGRTSTRSTARRAGAQCVLMAVVASAALAAGWAQNAVPGSVIARPAASVPVHIVREIRDPHSGARWQVVSDANRPGGPGRMVEAKDAVIAPAGSAAAKNASVPVIHPGDRVVVEDHTATAEAYLEAIAVDSAATGSRVNVRLKIGGRVVRAVAIAPGRAAFMHRGEAKP